MGRATRAPDVTTWPETELTRGAGSRKASPAASDTEPPPAGVAKGDRLAGSPRDLTTDHTADSWGRKRGHS